MAKKNRKNPRVRKLSSSNEHTISFSLRIDGYVDEFLEYIKNLKNPSNHPSIKDAPYFTEEELEIVSRLVEDHEFTSEYRHKKLLKKFENAQLAFMAGVLKDPYTDGPLVEEEHLENLRTSILKGKITNDFIKGKIEDLKKALTSPYPKAARKAKEAKAKQEEAQKKAQASKKSKYEVMHDRHVRQIDQIRQSCNDRIAKLESKHADEKKSLQDENDALTKLVETLKAQLEEKNGLIIALNTTVDKLNANLEQKENRISNLEKSSPRKHTASHGKAESTQKAELVKQNRELAIQIEDLQARIKTLEEENDRLKESPMFLFETLLRKTVRTAVSSETKALHAQIALLEKTVAGQQAYISKTSSQQIPKHKKPTKLKLDPVDKLREWGFSDEEIEILANQRVLYFSNQERKRNVESLAKFLKVEFAEVSQLSSTAFENAINGDDFDFVVLTYERSHTSNNWMGSNFDTLKKSPKFIDGVLTGESTPMLLREIVNRAKARN